MLSYAIISNHDTQFLKAKGISALALGEIPSLWIGLRCVVCRLTLLENDNASYICQESQEGSIFIAILNYCCLLEDRKFCMLHSIFFNYSIALLLKYFRAELHKKS
jgi:hypothetical protein